MKRDLDCGETEISVENTSAMPGIFFRGTEAVEISSMLLVLRSNGIRCTLIRRKDGGFKLLCDSYIDLDCIAKEEVTSALRIINCDLVMSIGIQKQEGRLMSSPVMIRCIVEK